MDHNYRCGGHLGHDDNHFFDNISNVGHMEDKYSAHPRFFLALHVN